MMTARPSTVRSEELRVHALSEVAWPETYEDFAELVGARVPVVFRGAAAGWPCTQRWTAPYLRERLADKQVTATRAPSRRYRPNPTQGHYAPTDMQRMAFGEFMDRICAPSADAGPDTEDTSYYLHRQSLDQHLPELRDDVVVPRHLESSALLLMSLWMGPAGSVTPIHHDFTDNLFVQVQGRKRVILYDPDPDAAFYRLPFRANNGRSSWHVSRVGSRDTADLDAHPLFRNARAFEAVMGPGDMLLIPSFFWHEVHSLDSPSISLSYWWDPRSLAETEGAIAKVTEFVAFYDQQPASWRSLIDSILRSR
jgi:[protein]-arginine 3-hydroxylase / protease